MILEQSFPYINNRITKLVFKFAYNVKQIQQVSKSQDVGSTSNW